MIELLNQHGRLWAGYFGPAVIQNTVFLGLVLIVLHRLRNAPARIRYAVGLIGLAKLLLPPLIRVPEVISSTEPLRAIPATLAPVTFIPIPGGAGTAAGAAASPGAAGILALLWAACALGYLAVSIARTVRLALILRSATPLPGAAEAAGGAEGGVRLYSSDRIAMPLTLGIFPRKIFVPRAWDQWSRECRIMIIRHEMAHITRHDGIFQVFQIAAQALYWFHPLVWLLNRRLSGYREMACDDVSVGRGRGRSVAYSRYLVEIAESMMRRPVPCESASALIRQRNELLTRVRYQMKGGTTMRVTRAKAAMVLVGLALLILPLSWYFSGATAGQPGAGSSWAVPVRSQEAPGSAGADGAPAGPAAEKKVVEIRVAADASVKVNGTPTDFDGLERELKRFPGGKQDGPVIRLVCDPNITMGTIYRLQDVLRRLDLVKMDYLTMQGEGLSLVLPPLDVEGKLEDIPEENIAVIAIGAVDQAVIIGKGTFEPKEVGKVIRNRLAGNPLLIVWIRTSDETRYGNFLTVLEEVKKAGAKRIVVNEG